MSFSSYNSAVYFSIGPTEYSIVAAQDKLIQEHGNSTEFEQCFTENVGMDLPSFNAAIREVQHTFQARMY